MVPQREIPISSFYIGTGALQHLRERGRVRLERILVHRAEGSQRAVGLKQRLAEALGKRP